jgi:RNA polymerase sigma-70 factor (ECF subfamily)
MDFWHIHDEYYSRVRGFILGLVKNEAVADDLVQETFIRIQKGLDDLRDPAKLTSWVFRIAHNLCQDHFRKSREYPIDEEAICERNCDLEEKDLQKELEQQEMGECVQDKVNMLPESLRSVILLFDTMDLSQREVAEILGITVENVKVRLHRARKRLREILQEECTFELDERNVLVCEPSKKKT